MKVRLRNFASTKHRKNSKFMKRILYLIILALMALYVRAEILIINP